MTTDEPVPLHHLIEGPENAPVLVMANSLGATLNMWDEQAGTLRDRFRLLRYDHRGHGGSSVPPGPYGIDDLRMTLMERRSKLTLQHRQDVLPQVVDPVWAGRMLRGTPAEGYAGCCEAIRDADLNDRLGAIRASTLVIAGADDPAAPVEQAGAIRDGVPGARLVVIPQAAHLANVEQPEDFTHAVRDHLVTVER